MSVRERHLRERLARKDAILAAAATVFARHGLEGATVEMVAREAEVAVGTIYLYFCSRDDLYLSLVAERLTRVRSRYLEVKARGLGPLGELRAMARVYLDYLGESRGLFMTQLSVAHTQLGRRLKRKAEIDNFRRVMALGRELFDLWEGSVKRVYDKGLIPGGLSATRTAVVLWASLNGAFLLTGDEDLFREITGLGAEKLAEEALNFQLAPAGADAPPEKAVADSKPARRSHPAATGRARSGTKNKETEAEQTAASTAS